MGVERVGQDAERQVALELRGRAREDEPRSRARRRGGELGEQAGTCRSRARPQSQRRGGARPRTASTARPRARRAPGRDRRWGRLVLVGHVGASIIRGGEQGASTGASPDVGGPRSSTRRQSRSRRIPRSRPRKEKQMLTATHRTHAAGRRWACSRSACWSSASATRSSTSALPTIQEELDASSSELQWIVDSYLLLFAGLLLVAGSLGDRFGRRRALVAGLVVFGARLRPRRARLERSTELIALTRADGHRRGRDHADDALDHHQHLPGGGAPEGDRRLGRRRRAGRRDRPDLRRLADRALLLERDLPLQPAGRRRRASPAPRCSSPSRATRSRPAARRARLPASRSPVSAPSSGR